LYDVTEGTLLIDGTDIRKIPLEVLRSHIGYVPQETFLFSETIAENIRYGIASNGELELAEAGEISQLSKDVLVFSKQYETMIGERGITLSGGQKQRTSIARAILRKPKILILDDALSAVDTYTEERILQQLHNFMKDRTSIIISHRISTVKDADLIVVLQNGKIVEQGTHDKLVALDGIYSELHRKQLLERQLEAM
jgi:ATP-binding cassette subfamily B protein